MQRRRFSERHGYRTPRDVVQTTSLDDATRTALWNCLIETWFNQIYEYQDLSETSDENALRIRKLWSGFFERALDDLDGKDWSDVQAEFREFVETGDWHDVYDFLETVVDGFDDDPEYKEELQAELNQVLARYTCGYRFVSGLIVPITDGAELDALTESLNDKNDAVSSISPQHWT